MAANTKKPSSEHVETYYSSEPIHETNIFEEKKRLSPWQAFKTFPRIVILSLAACSAGMMFGYDQIVNGASISLPSFILYFGAISTTTHEPYLPSIWTSLWTAMSALMQAVGGLAIAPISDRYGRKWTAVACCFLSAGGVAIQFASTSRGMLLAGKMVNGTAIGAALAVATAWASEIAPVCLRGPIQSAIVLWTVLLQALGLVVLRQNVSTIEESAFRLTFAIQWAFCALTAVLFALVPESPTWFILKDKTRDAKKSIGRLYGKSDTLDARFGYIQRQVQGEFGSEQASGIGRYLDLYRGSNFKRTMTSTYFLIISGFPTLHTFDVSIGGFALALITIVLSWIYIERAGRRTLWLIGCVVNAAVMAVIGGLYYAQSKNALWAVGILMNILVCWQNTTLTSVAWVIAGEISPYRLRSKNQSIAVLSNSFTTWLFNFTVPYMYNVDSGNLGARTGFIFAGASVLLFAASYLLVPNLQGFGTLEIDWLYQHKISVRKFQEHQEDVASDLSAREGSFADAKA